MIVVDGAVVEGHVAIVDIDTTTLQNTSTESLQWGDGTLREFDKRVMHAYSLRTQESNRRSEKLLPWGPWNVTRVRVTDACILQAVHTRVE